MARIALRRDAFEQGQLPSVCCKTGRPADAFTRWTFTKGLTGLLPMSSRGVGRVAVARRFVWIFGVVAAGAFVAGLARFDALVPIGVALAVLSLAALFLVWTWSPRAKLEDPDVVLLSNVHRGFVAAIEAIPA